MNKLILLLLTILLASCGSAEKEEKVGENFENVGIPVKDVVEHYDNGVVKIRGKERDGKRIGKWESFYENGYKEGGFEEAGSGAGGAADGLEALRENNYKSGYRDGPTIVYYKNGMMRYDGRYYNDERTGIWQFYDSTGVLIKKLDMDSTTFVPDSLMK